MREKLREGVEFKDSHLMIKNSTQLSTESVLTTNHTELNAKPGLIKDSQMDDTIP